MSLVTGRRRVRVVLPALLLAGGCMLSPQPDPPGANVVASAADGHREVAVIGGAGAVPPNSAVRVDDIDGDGAWAGVEASQSGEFVVVVPSAPGHRLAITYTVFEEGEWRVSRPREIVVDRYDPLPDALAAEDGDFSSPYAPGAGASGGFESDLSVDPPVSGLARLWCSGDCVGAGVRVIVANEDRGEVTEAVHGGGPFELSVRASIGDVLLVFAVLAEHPAQSSVLVRLVVPAR
jgi:hypothetical protein